MFSLSFQRYIDENGNKWIGASPLQGTGFGYAEYNWLSDAIRSDNFMGWGDDDGEGSGGGGGGGRGWISLAAVRSYYQRVWGSMGRYNIDANYSGGVHTGMGFNVTYNADEVHYTNDALRSDFVSGSMFVSSERMGQLLGYNSYPQPMLTQSSLMGDISPHLVGPAMILAGQPWLTKRFVTQGSSSGTSLASYYLNKAIPFQSPIRLPSIAANKSGVRIVWTRSIGKFAGRWVPVVGWVLLAKDIYDIVESWDGPHFSNVPVTHIDNTFYYFQPHY